MVSNKIFALDFGPKTNSILHKAHPIAPRRSTGRGPMFSLLRNAYLHCKERADRSFPVLMLGLDNAGKTTVIHALQGVVPRGASAPTVGYAPHTVAVSGLDLTFIDLGGGRRIRGIWKHYYAEVSDFFFLIIGTACGFGC